MNKMFLMLLSAALLALTANTANAQYPGGAPAPGPIMPAVYGGDMSGGHMHGGFMPGGHGGLMPGGLGGGLFSGIFTNHGGHGRKGPIRRLMGDDQRAQNAQVLPVATGGTLVFPQNPFVRSPRDFFMYYER